MTDIPHVLRHFVRSEHASLHAGNAALYGVISSEPTITPVTYGEFSKSAGAELAARVEKFAADHNHVFSEKDSIGYDVLYTDMSNNVATFFFLTTTSGQTIFVNYDGLIEKVG
jgi:hypothetical protein